MSRFRFWLRGLGLGLMGLTLTLACSRVTFSFGDETTPTADLAATAAAIAAQTIQAQTTAQEEAPATAAAPSPLPPTAVSPTATATPPPLPTATPQPPPPTATPRPEVTFTATANTRCRQGPGVYYPQVGVVAAGQTVPVLARTDAVEGYWLVQLPDGRTCWAWDRYATLQGNAAALPLATPPPAPDAAFSLFYIDAAECGANRGLTFELVNRGPVPIESAYIEIQGTSYRVSAGLQFQWWLDCNRKGSAHTIQPGRSVWITVPTGTEDLRTRAITVYAKACTEDNLNGTCFERTLSFRP